MKTINDRIEAIAAAAQGSAELDRLQTELKESFLRADELSQKMLALFAILAGVWMLLKLSTTDKIAVLGLEITDIPLLLAVIPGLVAFAFYQFICTEGLAALIDASLRSIYRKQFPASYLEDMTELLTSTSIQHIEASLVNMEVSGSLFSKLFTPWLLVLSTFLLLIPIGILGWMFVTLFYLGTVPMPIRGVSLLITALLTLRSATVFIQWMRAL